MQEHGGKDTGSTVFQSEEANGPCLVRLGDLLDEMDTLIRRYSFLYDSSLSMIVACWIANTYVYSVFDYCGYLALRSATPRCGKSKLLRLIGLLAKGNPPITSNPTAAVLFRSNRDVLLLDEVDGLRNQDKERYGDVLAVLNSGFERDRQIERMERSGSGFQLKAYNVYGPKALAGIEALADTLADRAFQIQMKRTPQRMPRLNPRKLSATMCEIRRKLEQWATEHTPDLIAAYEQFPDTVPALEHFDDRFQDISEPLFLLAAVGDAERTEGPGILPRLERGLNIVAGRREPSSREGAILAFLELIGERLGTSEDLFIPSVDLVQACTEREELSYLETSRRLASFLKHLDLCPKSNGSKRGYGFSHCWYREWHERYANRVLAEVAEPGAQASEQGVSSVKVSNPQSQRGTHVNNDLSKAEID